MRLTGGEITTLRRVALDIVRLNEIVKNLKKKNSKNSFLLEKFGFRYHK